MLCLHFSTMFKLLNFIFVFKSFSFICSNYSAPFVQIIQLQPTIPHGLLGHINLSKWSSSVNVFCVYMVSNFIQWRCHGYGTYERTNGGTWKDRACDPCLAISMNYDWHEWFWCNNKVWPSPNYLCCTLLWGLGSLQSQLGKSFLSLTTLQNALLHSRIGFPTYLKIKTISGE